MQPAWSPGLPPARVRRQSPRRSASGIWVIDADSSSARAAHQDRGSFAFVVTRQHPPRVLERSGSVGTMKADGTECHRRSPTGVGPTGRCSLKSVPGVASIVEGNSGTKVLQIPVSLSAPSRQTVTATWTTSGGSAGPGDYVPAQRDRDLPRQVRPPRRSRSRSTATPSTNRTSRSSSHSPIRPTPTSAASSVSASATITQRRSRRRAIVPGAASIIEGNTGTKVLQIPVSLSAPSGQSGDRILDHPEPGPRSRPATM